MPDRRRHAFRSAVAVRLALILASVLLFSPSDRAGASMRSTRTNASPSRIQRVATRSADQPIHGGTIHTFTPTAVAGATVLSFSNGIVFDTRAGEPAMRPDWRVETYGAGPSYYLVQFTGPIRAEWKTALEGSGAKVVGYQPNYAYVVRADAAAMGRVLSDRKIESTARVLTVANRGVSLAG